MQHCATHLNCNGNNYSLYASDGDLKFERCNDCSIIWRSKDSLEIEKIYDEEYFESKDYAKNRKHKVKKSGWLIDLARLHHENVRSLLEIGCSIGYTLEAAKHRGIDHLGTDISHYAIDHCLSLGLNAENAGLNELLESEERYDLIFKQHVLEHFHDPFSVLNECNALLNNKGLILIMVPNSQYYRAEKGRNNHRFYNRKGVGAEHYAYFNYSNLEKVLNATGFEVVQKNYPILACQYFSVDFLLNRIFRRMMRLFGADQEILVIARKISNS